MEPDEVKNNCQGEWINDCPYVECKCALKNLEIQRERDEDYKEETLNAAWSFFYWFVFLFLFLALIFSLAFCS